MKTRILLFCLLVLQSVISGAQEKTTIDGHEFVDLALPSGTLWATSNIGASSPASCGIFVSWGEVQQKDKTKYNWINYKHVSATQQKTGQRVTMQTPTSYKIQYKKYCFDPAKGVVDKKLILDEADDAAIAHWGSNWCMPTVDQLEELIENCNWEMNRYDDKIGFTVTGSNGNTIFFPMYGILQPYISEVNSRYLDNNVSGYFWTKSVHSTQHGKLLKISNNGSCTIYNELKYRGANVRAVVSPKAQAEYKAIHQDPLLPLYLDESKKAELGITDLTPFEISPYYGSTYSGDWDKNMEALKKVMDEKYKHPKCSEEMKASAEKGNLEAKFLLGYCTLKGLGCKADYYEGKRLLEEAAKLGSKKALVMLFVQRMAGYDIRSPFTKLLAAASNENYPPAVVVYTLESKSVELSRYNQRENIIRESPINRLSMGDVKDIYPEASYIVGSTLDMDIPIQQAATRNHPYAALQAACRCYENKSYGWGLRYARMAQRLGIDVPDNLMYGLEVNTLLSSRNASDIAKGMIQAYSSRSYALIESAYANAKSKGIASDEIELCMSLVKREHGGSAENAQAFELLKKCAEQGSVFAQEQLALTYERGIGLDNIDMANAIAWYRKAAQAGSKKAQNFLSGRNLKW